MSGAYRTTRIEGPKKTAEAGIVDDMVRQFADRYAFLRELAQNGIDAGATRIEVRVEREIDGRVITSVDDDGSGMTRAIIEGPLLTLFSSSKENDSSKIGKYGIGFVSVFAIEPDVVEVRTRRDTEMWLVRLFGDHSFELVQNTANNDARPANGTTVSLVQSKTESFETHVASATRALYKWCRHARVPVVVTILDATNPAAMQTINITEPMAVAGAVIASLKGEDGEYFVVGAGNPTTPTTEPPTFGGFYNRGLTLYESNITDSQLEDIRFKVESPRLSHTISRDNVKRDREHARVMRTLRELVRTTLYRELVTQLERAAHAVAAGGDEEEYRRLLAASQARAFAFAESKGIVVPLVDLTKNGRSVVPIVDIKRGPSGDILIGDTSTLVTRALAKAGHHVVRRVAQMALFRLYGVSDGISDPENSVAFVSVIGATEAKTHPNDDALGAALVTILGHAGKRAARVRFAHFVGVGNGDAFRVVGRDVEELVSKPKEPEEKREWGGAATIFLNVEHASIRLSRRRAKSDVWAAAYLLCRALLLLADGALSERVVDRLLEVAVRS